MNELFLVPKDLAYREMRARRGEEGSCDLGVYKACVDIELTSATVLDGLWYLADLGCFAIECSHRTLSHVVDLCEDLSYGYDVVYFRGGCVEGHKFHTRRAKQIPYVLLYKNADNSTDVRGQMTNEVTLVSESPSDEIMEHLLGFADTRRVLFIGDSLIMAPKAIALGHEIVCFGDNPLSVIILEQLGVKLREVEP